MSKEISILGCVMVAMSSVFFVFAAVKIFGWLGLIVGPVVALMAFRPAKEGGLWAWQKYSRKEAE